MDVSTKGKTLNLSDMVLITVLIIACSFIFLWVLMNQVYGVDYSTDYCLLALCGATWRVQALFSGSN